MYSSLTTSYLLPAIFLNPVLFLHSLNTILSRILPPIVVSASVQPPPYSMLGPSGNHPHIDVRNSDNVCWGYTAVIICAQLVAFDRVSTSRAKMKEARKRKREEQKRGRQTRDTAEIDIPWKENGSVKKAGDKSKWEAKKDFQILEGDETEVTEVTEDEMML